MAEENLNNSDHLFQSEADWWNDAWLNYLPNGWSVYAIGYKNAADSLVMQVVESKEGDDALVYPILFLYRQYLELALKNLIRAGRGLTDRGDSEVFPKTHRIDILWNRCHDILIELSPNDCRNDMQHIGKLISEFVNVDPTSIAFRYPEDKKGDPTLPGIEELNVRNVGIVISKIASVLEGFDSMIDGYLSIQDDMNTY